MLPLQPQIQRVQRFNGLTINDIKDDMLAAANEPNGYRVKKSNVHLQPMAIAVEACHLLALLHSRDEGDEIWYLFPSRVHQRYA